MFTMLQNKKLLLLIVFVSILALGALLAGSQALRDHRHHNDADAIVVSTVAKQLGFSYERPLVMGMNTDYAPLQYVDEQGIPQGFDVEFTRLLMQRMGIPFTLAPNHWDKMSPGIIEGKYDLGMLVYSPYRKNLTNYSNAVFRMYYQIVFRKKDYADFDFRHLRGKTIAYMKSRPIGIMLRQEGAHDVPVTDLAKAFHDLASGQYDGLICYRFQGAYNIEKAGLQDVLDREELSLEPREYCYASHDLRLIKAINNELKRMSVEGIVEEVYGDNVISEFGENKIPTWLWALIGALCFAFLSLFSIHRYLYSKRLQQANEKLREAYDEMAEQNEELQIANSRAEESTRMKSNFIKQISHEIRTPLNVLSGFTQILTTPGAILTDNERAEAEHQISESTNRITSLVNKMLELSDMSSHQTLNRKDRVTPLQIAEQAIYLAGVPKATHVIFDQVTKEGADLPFMTDQRAAVRILELVLDNALKFTRSAEAYALSQDAKKEYITLTIRQNAGVTRFVVDDTGIGIPTVEAEHIFDEFVQLDEYYNGTGIGLTVARSLARRLGGDVKLDTTCTLCTRFIITLKATAI